MPCISDYGDEDRLHEEQKQREHIAALEASLCAILTVLENPRGKQSNMREILDRINEKEAGITAEQIESWFAAHKRKDELRRKREKQEAAYVSRVKAAKRKVAEMSEEERRAMREALTK
jgi:hypothetical protein